MRSNIIAIMYDFDKTLCTKNMQEYTFIPNLGMDIATFWNEVEELHNKNKMDQVLTYMYLMVKESNLSNNPITREYLNKMGRDIVLFDGVKDWFQRINEYGKSKGMQIEHYIISSGLEDIIEGTEIGKKFKKIYASEFYYDEFGNAVWPKLAVNYTNKTQFLIRVKKGTLDISDDDGLNKKTLNDDKRVSTSNMIYIGDGLTDVPCMKITKDGNGVSIAVYSDKSKNAAEELLKDGRINYMARANYSPDSEIDMIVKKTIDKMAIDTELENMSVKQIRDID